MFPGYLLSNYVVAHNEQKKLAPLVGLGSLGNIFLNALLIPPFGIIAAGITTVCSLLIYNGLIWRVAKKINNFYTLRYLKTVAAASVLMGFISFTLNILGAHVLVTVVLSAAFYFATLFLLKERTLFEIKSIVEG